MRSSSPRSSRSAPRPCRRRLATRCSPEPHHSGPRPGGCSTSSRSYPGGRSSRSSRPWRPPSSSSSTRASSPGCSARTVAPSPSVTSSRGWRSSAVPAVRRRHLHAELLHALRDAPGGGDPARLAHHAERAGDAAAVLEWAPEAGRLAAASAAHREAAQQYARALRFAAGIAARDRAGLLDLYAMEAQLTGRYADAADAWREAAELHRGLGDRVAEGRSLSALTRACIPIGRNSEAEAASRSAIDVLESMEPGPELAEAYAHQAYVRVLVRDTDEGIAWGKRAAALAEQFDDFETLGWSLSLIGTSYVTGGAIDTGIEYLR